MLTKALSTDLRLLPCPSSPNIGFVLHNVARLLRNRFEQHSRSSEPPRAQWQVLAYLSRQEVIHLSADAQQQLQTLCLIKSNLLEACAQPAVDREKVHV
ncbi:hypothetical protein [Mesorhizobium sp. WSM3860]|uniref:hypothetical protein n=1 Tax=Mesorhizobium sp. WSM3860 TaxID=2029403 RepID=UPI000BB055D1|nr:hypothetical protein [Mesorhizobium sp. WSM3860]PBC05444.1 hypothetical protein CK220_05710 [Mesorhizobium sp. WSM3860]